MAQKRLTINLPGSAEALKNILEMLLKYNLISEKKARYIEEQENLTKPVKKSRWAQAAEILQSENCLKGRSKEANKLFQEFREEFEL
jgi:hypothetical protein